MTEPQPETHTSLQEWREWGTRDPMFGVATVPGKEAHGASPWTADDFYAMGQSEVEIFLAMWKEYLGAPPTGSLVEIGCGAGRLSKSFARTFSEVHGIDISPGMIAAASNFMPPNVTMHLGTGLTIPRPNASADAAFSYIVFQHFDNYAMIEAYFREIQRVLRPGGTMMIHVPAIEPVQRLRQLAGMYNLRRALTRLWKKANPASPLRFKGAVTMNFMMVAEETVVATLTNLGLKKIQVAQMPNSDKRGTFYFATRP